MLNIQTLRFGKCKFVILVAERCYLLYTWRNARHMLARVDDATLLEEDSIKLLHINTALYTLTNTERFLKKTLQTLTTLLQIENIIYS